MMMNIDNYKLSARLRKMAVETGSLCCFGCGYEHNCGIHGCRILKQAAQVIEQAGRCACQNREEERLHLQEAVARIARERDILQASYDAMAKDLELRTRQVRELQMQWRDPVADPPDLEAMNSDWVIGCVSGKVGGVIYANAIVLVSYESGHWRLPDYPSVDVECSAWMPMPDIPEVIADGERL